MASLAALEHGPLADPATPATKAEPKGDGFVLSGTVTDAMGAVVADVDVDAFDASTGLEVTLFADNSDATLVEAPVMVGGHADATDWIKMMDLLHERLADGFGIELPEVDG